MAKTEGGGHPLPDPLPRDLEQPLGGAALPQTPAVASPSLRAALASVSSLGKGGRYSAAWRLLLSEGYLPAPPFPAVPAAAPQMPAPGSGVGTGPGPLQGYPWAPSSSSPRALPWGLRVRDLSLGALTRGWACPPESCSHQPMRPTSQGALHPGKFFLGWN